ncbi:MAG: GNAT family N-acetyltransferase [Dehalococcoidia bacterium]|nr:GNAT family N-acetyltransferase [Dehalococcoidia bacterium]
MAVYPITRYPRDLELRDATKVAVRPMAATDCAPLLDFFRAIPEDERYFLKDDVSSPRVIQAWADSLDYDRALPLLAFDGDRVVGDAVLVRRRGGYRRHAAEARVVVAPDFRGKGLGVALLREFIEIAWDAELEQVDFEMVKGIQDDAIHAVEFLGGIKVGQVSDAVRDLHGDLHDAVFLRLPLGNYWKWAQF